MIFLTVGTSFPFDRLVKAVDEAAGKGLISQKIFAQVGVGGFKPKYFQSVETLDKKEFDCYFLQSQGIIAHAGMGTISMALDHNKPLLVMPRRKCFKELVNDHQLAAAERFEKLGHILAAYDSAQLIEKIEQLAMFVPVKRKVQPERVACRIKQFLDTIIT